MLQICRRIDVSLFCHQHNHVLVLKGFHMMKRGIFAGCHIIHKRHNCTTHIKQGPPWNILFFGSDAFSIPHIKALTNNRYQSNFRVVENIHVVVPGVKKSCPVTEYAADKGLKCHSWPQIPKDEDFDVGIVASFGHLLPREIINQFPYGILNVHPSLLPRWRGASPILHTLLSGDERTGISLMRVQPDRFDMGPLILQETFAVPNDCMASELTAFMGQEGARLLLQTLTHLDSADESCYPQAQDQSPTVAHKLNVTHARINWEQQSAACISRQYRALGEMFSLRSQWLSQPVKLEDMRDNRWMKTGVSLPRCEDSELIPPGTPHYCKSSDTLCIKCKDHWVGFGTVILRKPMSAKAFYNGYLSKSRNVGEVFTSLTNKLEKYWINQ